MSKSRGGLGRGLAALIPTGPATNTVSEVLMGGGPGSSSEPVSHDASAAAATPGHVRDEIGDFGQDRSGGAPEGPRYAEIPVGAIRPNPRNPRSVFDQDALDELAHSIREFGLLQPIVVRPVSDGFELVMGERRWRAALQVGAETVAAIVRRTEDADLLRDALLENIHRTNLNPLEEAAAYQQLLEEFDVTQEELAGRLGRSRPVISNTIRLLNLPVAVQRRVAAGVLSAGHARALLSLSEPGDQEELAARIVAEGLSVRGTEEAVTLLARRTPTVRRTPPRKMAMPGVQELATNLSDAFDTRVLVELGRRKGKIVVEFATVDDLERLVAIIAPTVAQHRRGGAPARPTGAGQTSNGTAGIADLYEVTATGFTGQASPDAEPEQLDGQASDAADGAPETAPRAAMTTPPKRTAPRPFRTMRRSTAPSRTIGTRRPSARDPGLIRHGDDTAIHPRRRRRNPFLSNSSRANDRWPSGECDAQPSRCAPVSRPWMKAGSR